MFQHRDLLNVIFDLFSERRTMPLLLIFITLLHLFTLALLYIATMDKVKNDEGFYSQFRISYLSCTNKPIFYNITFLLMMREASQSLVTVLCVSSAWLSPGGCGAALRSQTSGTTAGWTMKPRSGFVRHLTRQVKSTVLHYISCLFRTWILGFLSDWKQSQVLNFFPQSGFKLSKSWWSCLLSFAPSHFSFSWLSSLSCQKEDSSILQESVRHSQVFYGGDRL